MVEKYNEKHIDNYSYITSDILGKGTFGCVYKGKNMKSDEIVAIKVIDKKQGLNLNFLFHTSLILAIIFPLFFLPFIVNLKDPFLADSLKKEIKIMEKLKSQHIVKMFDVFGT